MLEAQLRQGSAYRSIRYSTLRKDSHTANPDTVSRPRFKSKIVDSTCYNTRTIELRSYSSQQPQSRVNPQKPTYLESFHSMLQSERLVKQNDDGFCQIESAIKFSNFDNKFEKEDGTEFTLLDPFNRPYVYLSRQVSKTEKEIRVQYEEIRLIRAQLGALRNAMVASLANTEEQGKKGVQRLRDMLKKNETKESERKMKVRREVTELYEYDDANRKTEGELNKRVLDMQAQIFACHPFELQVVGKVEAE